MKTSFTVLRLAVIFILAFLPLAASPAQNAIAAPVEKPLLDAPPLVSLQVPATAFIGANVTFTVTFDNPDPVDPGYGPLIDLIIPTSGPDGAPNPDGLTFISATYLGSNIENTAITVPASGCIAHPYMMDGGTQAPLQVCGLTLGDTFVALRLPFGSFTPDQPPLTITVNASMSNLADLGTPLTIQARGGYQYGYNPLNDFCCGDDPVATLSSWVNSSVTPILFTLEKTYSGPEDETATGPNYPRQYTVTAQIAPGQTLSPFTMTDILPDNMQFVSIISPVSGCTVPSTVTPGGTLSCAFASASGTVSMTFSFYIPLRDLGGASVISPGTGDDVLSCNNASGGGTWTPIDSRDLPASDQTIDQPGCEHTLTDKSIATQKGVAVVGGGQPAPGRILEYTVDVQVSDFFVFDQVVVTDTFSDGQRWDTTFTPTLQILGNPATLDSAGNFNVANYTVSPNYTPADPAPNDGTTTITFRVSDEMISRSADGRLIGGCVPPAGTPGDPNCGVYDNGATTARIVFRTVIQEDFSDTFPSGDSSVDQGDVLDNTETVNGRLLSTTDATTPTGFAEADGSSASVTIGRGTLSKAVYAVSGVTPPPSPVRVASGDTVTFRLTYTLITSDFESLALTDYLPLPIFSATEVTAHNNSVCGVPAAGTSCLGPSDTYHSLPGAVNPAVSNDGVSNWVRWAYGNYDSAVNTASTIDLLFTVTVEDDPFADNMHLTNQAYATEGSTNGAPGEAASIIEITFTAPVMTTTKSAVATNAPAPIFAPALPVAFTPPGSGPLRWDWTTNPINSNLLTTTPIDSDVSGLDAGDLVTFAIFLVNEGSGINGAFDIAIRDTFDAAGFEFPTLGDPNSLNLQIYYGNGSGPIPYTGTPGDLFGTGIELVDPPSGDGVCQAHDPVSGNNVIVITYDLRLRNDIVPGTYPNTATLTNYSGSEGGPNFLPEPISDDATVTTDDPLLTKTLVGTELNTPQNSNTQVVIGELLTYTLTLTVPEGILPAAQIVDTLDAGLAFLDLSSVTFSNPDTDGAGAGDDGIYSTVMTLNAGGDCTNCTAGTTVGSNPLVSAFGGQDGRRITFDFGDLVNTNRDNNVDETITITYRAVVLNVVGNQSAGLRNNSAALTWTGDSLPAVSAPNVTIIEPVINTAKSVLPTTADAGDTVTFTVTLTNPAAGSTTAYDATWSDTLPAALTYAPGTLALGACTASTPLTLSDAGAPTLTGSGGLFQPGESCVITFDAAINYSAAPGQVITNTAVTQWTSLSGSVSDRSTYNTDSDERTGADGVGGALNDYASQGSANVTINSVQPQKSLVSTSELSTGTPFVAIGEIVRYRMVVQLPEGTSANFQIRDNLPSGLTYLDDGTARLALLSNGTPIVSSEPTASTLGLALGNGPFGSGPWVNGNDPTLVTPTYALPDPNVGSSNSLTADPDAYGNGTDPFFKLGTLTNNDSDGDAEYVIIEFNALVNNTAAGSNDAGDNRSNTFSVFISGTQNGPNSNSVQVTIAEPLLSLAKAVTTAPIDAGDPISYTLTITSASGVNRATAFDLNLSDTFDANLTGLTVSGVVPTQGAICTGNGAGVTAFSHNGGVFAGNSLTFTATCLDPGQTITLTIIGTVAATAPVGYVIPNTANLVYTSLPGPNGTTVNPTGSSTPGASGTDNGERNGSDGVGGAVDDYAATSSADTPLAAPLVDKLDPTPAQYVIGDLVTFNILVTLPEGVTPALQVVDDLPAGLEYVSHQVITAAASSDGILASNFNGTLPAPAVTAPGGSGGDLTLVFGDTTTADDNITTNNAFLVRVVARVLNIAGNQNGTVLTNTANVTWTGGSVTDSTAIALLEPVLNILKAADDSTWVYGQTVTFTLSLENLVANGSTVDAHDVVITDAIPAGLTYVPASITAAGGCAANDTGSPTLAWTCVSVPLGATLNFSYQVTVNSPPTPPFIAGDATVTNTATTTWTSQPGDNNPGADDGERDGSGGVDDYSDSGSHTGGLEQYYSLGNRVWFDTDNDGTMDAGEQPVAGVLVQLYAASDLTTILASDVTNADGFYLFDYLVPGDYVVAIAADNFDTAGTYNALVGYWSSGTTINGAGAISELTAPNADTDNTDADDNGTLNGQALLPGAVVAQAVTLGPSGLTEPTGEVAGQLDPVEGQGAQPDGRANMTVDFGFYRVEIGNLVYRDNNVDGVYDGGDTLLENVTVELLSGTGASLGITTQTNALGEYRFSGLPEGDYRVRVTTPSGHVSTIDTFNPADTADPDDNVDNNDNGIGIGPATVANVSSGVLTMTSGQGTGGSAGAANNVVTQSTGTTYDPTLDFGFTYAYALGNRVWYDTDNNSQIDFAGGEVGVNGVTVQLYAADGSGDPTGPVLATDLTANGGYYLFDSLTAGDYVVVLPATNFGASAVLEGYWSSATYRDTSAPYAILETAAPDPDGAPDVDSDDNGQLDLFASLSGAVASRAVTLGPGVASELTGETDLDGGSQGSQPDGRANMTVDFGFYQVEVGNLVFSDLNKNGTFDGSDTLIAGATVRLYASDGTTEITVGLDGILGTADDAAGGMPTDAFGLYLFSGLPAGNYIISVEAPANASSTIDNNPQNDNDNPNWNVDNNDNGDGTGEGEVFSEIVTLTPGGGTRPDASAKPNVTADDASGTTTDLTVDFGFVTAYALGNRVWFDTDNSRDINGSEVGVDDVLVELYYDDGAGNPGAPVLELDGVTPRTDVTANGGYYLFDYLEAGNYVVVIPEDNFVDSGVGDTYTALVDYWSSGTSRNNNGSLTEIAAPDPDDDEDSDDNGTLRASDAVISLPVTLGGATPEPINEGDLQPVVGQGAQPDGRANMTVDFGFYRVEIGNLVYRDNNVDGAYDGGDTLLANVTVELLSGDGLTLLATTTTNAGGEYRFSGQPEGDYIVRVTTPSGHVSTIDTSDLADTTDPDENTDDNDNGIGIGPATVTNVQSGVVTLDAGNVGAQSNNLVTNADGTTFDPTLDFGFTYAYALGNRVWFDTDNNSQIDFANGEVGVNGVTVQLYAADGSGDPTGPVLATDLTANGGYYLFDSLTAGDYVVVIPATNFAASAVLEGYWSSATYRDTSAPYAILEAAAPDPDGAPDVDSDDNGQLDLFASLSGTVASRAVTLGPTGLTEPTGESDVNSLAPGADNQGLQPDGRANMTVDFGFYKVSVGDLVWADADRDGEYDSGEPLLQAVTVNLYAPDGTTLLATTTTDANGEYTFDDLPEGAYVISVIAPNGTFSTVDTANPADTTDPNSNADNNDNGIGVGGGEVFSNPVQLIPGSSGAQNNNQITNSDGTTHNPTLDFGFTPVYSLGNRVWYDTNNSRAINFGDELGIDDVRVQLFDTAGVEILVGPDGILGTGDDATGGMLTDNGGYYLFNGLEAGEYVVVIPASNFAGVLNGYWSSGASRNNDGSLTEIAAPDPDNDVDSHDNGTFQTGGVFPGAVVSLPVTLGPTFNEPLNESDLDAALPGNQQGQPDAQANMTVDFGFYTTRLGNQIWNDLDNSGLLDGAEAGINGVTVELWSADGSTLLATPPPTAGGGIYSFTGLPQGNYIVRLPQGNFIGAGALRDYYSSTGPANGYEPAPNPDADLTDSDDNGSEVGSLGFAGGYIQSAIFALTPQAEQTFDHNQGLTNEFRVDFGVFNSPQVDLAVTKDDGQDFYLPGGILTYTIVVSNNGPADVTGAVVSDSIPAQIASWTWACSGATGGATDCDGVAGSNTDFTDTVNLPVGSTITYTVTATVDAAATGQLTNTVIVAPPAGTVDTNPSNDEAVDVDEPASLTVTKTNAVSVVAIGTQFTYDIEVTNNGGVALSDLTVVDSLPAEVTFVSAMPVPSNVSGSTLTWNHVALGLAGTFNPGDSFTIQVTVDVTSVPTSPGGDITNSVTVSNSIPDVTATATHTDVVADNRTKSLVGTIMAAGIDPVTGVVIPSVPDYTTTPEVAIGEILTYQISVDVPAGLTLTNLKALDTMDAGLAFVRCVGIASGSLTTTLPGGFSDACNAPVNPTVGREPLFSSSAYDDGRRVEFTLGDVSATGAETLTIIYEVIVLDIPANVDGVGGLNNQVTWSWDGGSLTASADPVEIVEPELSIEKDANPTVAPYGATITFTLDIAHTIDSTADAFDVVVTDILPPGLAFIPGTVVTTGLPPTTTTYDAASTTLTFVWDVFPLNETALLTFQATFVGPAPVINTSNVAWTSLPIDPGLGGEPVQLSPYNDYSTERWYDPADSSGVNNYGVSDSITIRVPGLPETGFAPGRVTALPAQSADKQYAAMNAMWLEIPDLGLTMPLTGVPLTADGWDLTWLSNQAGYLQGTTYPGEVGTMGITSHVTLADGTPGPFRNLGKLFWGNKIILHAEGYRYVYEVRDQRTVLPTDLSVFKKDGYTWMTLLTCEGYVPWLDSYNYRLAVRAVLLSVEPDSSTSPFPVRSPAPAQRGVDR